jgi:hypothetical protein
MRAILHVRALRIEQSQNKSFALIPDGRGGCNQKRSVPPATARQLHACVDRDLAHQKKSLTDRELITLARQHDRRGVPLLYDPLARSLLVGSLW